MNLVSIRIIAEDIEGMIKFYEKITERQVIRYTPDFVELKTNASTLAIGSKNTLQFFGSKDLGQTYQNLRVIIEFMVENVDQDYERLTDFLQPYLIQAPTTMPWGNRSLLFHDPEGNCINFFTPVSKEAILKFASSK